MQAGWRVVSRALMTHASTTWSGDGCLRRLLAWVLLATGLLLGVALVLLLQAQDLSDLSGAVPRGPARDLPQVLQRAVTHQYPITLTEGEINQWLGRALVARQGGCLAGVATLERVWVRLQDGCAEVVLVRHILGQPFTVSMFLQLAQTQGAKGTLTEVLLHGGPYGSGSLPLPQRGGRFGKLVVPQGFLRLVTPAYAHLAEVFRTEIHLGFEEMTRVKIERGRLVMDPRLAAEEVLGRP